MQSSHPLDAIIDAPIDRVWAILRDFNSHTAWHPVVAESGIEGDEPVRPRRAACATSRCATVPASANNSSHCPTAITG
jgi:hypothetical protein